MLANRVISSARVAYSEVALALSPTALYMMEEGSGTQMTDASGNANHGTYQNGALPSTPGLITEGAKSLNPVSNLYATAPGAVASALSGFSIVLWLQWSHSSNLVICERNQNLGYSIQTDTTGKINLVSWTTGPVIPMQSASAINNGAPHCVVLAIAATVAASYMFVDGVDVTTRPVGSISPSYGSTTVWDIGSRAGTLAMDGRLDGVLFVGSQLTLGQAQALNSAGR